MYNTTTIIWTTHQPEGLTAKDVDMAAFCDERAREYGELVGEEEDAGSCGGCHPKGSV